jgi:GT2 family glycosyltransferase
MDTEKVTIGIINYNGMEVLPATLQALGALRYPDCTIMVVDNDSTDGSKQWLQQQHPEVRCLALPTNVGLPGGRNVVLQHAQTEYVLIMDNDISLEPDTLSILMQVLRENPRAGLCHPELRDENDPGVYHYNGGSIHYLCALIARSKPLQQESRPPSETFDVISGGVLLLRRRLALEIGGFDGDYFFNWEDGDFTARMTLAGYPCLNVPAAIAHHRSKPRGTSKVFYQVRNRWYFILKLYHWRTLCLTAPMLLLFEGLQAGLLLKKGAMGDYLRGTTAAVRDLPTIISKRRTFQKMKKMRDRDWLRAGQMYVPPQLDQRAGLMEQAQQGFYGLCRLYWSIVRPFC